MDLLCFHQASELQAPLEVSLSANPTWQIKKTMLRKRKWLMGAATCHSAAGLVQTWQLESVHKASVPGAHGHPANSFLHICWVWHLWGWSLGRNFRVLQWGDLSYSLRIDMKDACEGLQCEYRTRSWVKVWALGTSVFCSGPLVAICCQPVKGECTREFFISWESWYLPGLQEFLICNQFLHQSQVYVADERLLLNSFEFS